MFASQILLNASPPLNPCKPTPATLSASFGPVASFSPAGVPDFLRHSKFLPLTIYSLPVDSKSKLCSLPSTYPFFKSSAQWLTAFYKVAIPLPREAAVKVGSTFARFRGETAGSSAACASGNWKVKRRRMKILHANEAQNVPPSPRETGYLECEELMRDETRRDGILPSKIHPRICSMYTDQRRSSITSESIGARIVSLAPLLDMQNR